MTILLIHHITVFDIRSIFLLTVFVSPFIHRLARTRAATLARSGPWRESARNRENMTRATRRRRGRRDDGGGDETTTGATRRRRGRRGILHGGALVGPLSAPIVGRRARPKR